MKTRLLVILAFVVACLAIGAALYGVVCPHCGNEVDVTLSKPDAPPPEPPTPPSPPPAPRERFVLGAGAFEIADSSALQKAGLTNTEFIAWWRDVAGGTWNRFQTLAYHNDPARGRGLPAIVHVGPDPKYSEAAVVAYLEQSAKWSSNFAWHMYDEKPWDDSRYTLGGKSPWYWLDYVRARWPRMLVFTGPLGWTAYNGTEHFAPFDAIVSYQNATRDGRDPYDFWYHQALANLYGKPLVFSCNLLDSGEPPDFADPARYETFLRQGAYANALLIWGSGRLFLVAKGVKAGVHAERVPELLDLIKRVPEFQEAEKFDRPKVKLAFEVPSSASGNGWKRNCGLCRIAGRAGFDPVPVLLGDGELPSGGAWGFDGAALMLTDGTRQIPMPEKYLGLLVWRADPGHWTPELDARVEKMEADMAEGLKGATP
ncbi:MAG TPA: hypothetical protein VM492_13510 [Sumerlaeia bacterium]|nr:hypothetical protein [Sumerlaeia bacterium]